MTIEPISGSLATATRIRTFDDDNGWRRFSTVCPFTRIARGRRRVQPHNVSWSHVKACGLAVLSRTARALQEAALPNSCAFCGTRLPVTVAPVCTACDRDLPRIAAACSRCGVPLATTEAGAASCGDCQRDPPPFVTTVAPLSYAFPVDAAIRALKFQRTLCYAAALGDVLLRSLPQLPPDIEALLPVPLHWRRQALRGFNQATELCRPLCRQAGFSILQQVARGRATPYQSGLDAQRRQRNLNAAFHVRDRIRARHVLIVDDVITTGATCRELARVLLDAGVAKVSALAVARA